MLEVTRHGQRAPEKIFDLAADPKENFKTPHNLSYIGAASHHQTGSMLREKIDSLDPKFLSHTYDPNEIYVQSTCHSRCVDSAIAQLEGLYDLPLQFPEVDKSFEITTIICNED